MKKILAILIAAVMLASMAACVSYQITDTGDTGDTGDTVPTDFVDETGDLPEDFEEPGLPETAISVPYTGVIGSYRTALTEQWDVDKLEENGLSYLCRYFYEDGKALDNLGYMVKDIDGDGVAELIVGVINDPSEFLTDCIFQLYTLDNETPVLVKEGGERDLFYLLKDNTFLESGSSSAFLSGKLHLKLEGSKLTVIDAVTADSNADEANPYFLGTDDDWDVSNDKPISSDEAMAWEIALENQISALDLTPFSQF